MGSRYQPCQSDVWSVLHIVGILIRRAGGKWAGALTEKRTGFLTDETRWNEKVDPRSRMGYATGDQRTLRCNQNC